jgi:DNA-binding FrmR family transcriptional regulator
MLQENKGAILNRVKTVRGHLDGIVRMVEEEAYHLETCFSEAVTAGGGEAAIAELVDAVKFSQVLTGPRARVAGSASGEAKVKASAGAKRRSMK